MTATRFFYSLYSLVPTSLKYKIHQKYHKRIQTHCLQFLVMVEVKSSLVPRASLNHKMNVNPSQKGFHGDHLGTNVKVHMLILYKVFWSFR